MLLSVNHHASLVILALVAALAAVVLAPARAEACSCMQTSFEDARAGSAAIFEGRVESVEPIDELRVRVTLHVTQAWGGVERERVDVVTANNSAACGFAFEVGEHYLVYAGRDEEAQTLSVSLCSRTARMDDAGEDRGRLGSGTIPVEVEDEPDRTPREAPATRAGCASCSAAGGQTPSLALLGVFGALVLVGRRRSRR